MKLCIVSKCWVLVRTLPLFVLCLRLMSDVMDSALVTSLLHFDTKAPLFITSNNVAKNLSLCPRIAWCRVRRRYGRSACFLSFSLDTFGTQAHRFAPNTLSEGDGQRSTENRSSLNCQINPSARMRRAHEVQSARLEACKPSLCSSLRNSAFSVHTTNVSSSSVGFETLIDSEKKRP
ncbi:hypothetical protein T4B_13776 [Trichinella pseudospiralis]|uniref:Secreted protein n=1 Tax=Trichinella pseudospiralis TaxID=6337 RepID=A0A0V1JMY8_TRIPS|nr:hypothetical protein T4B_13776 [Trichinella pseudospiralis]KRZ36355.1 hypothetical protein T4C_3732 [Trichinella pseudospiralis]